MLRHYRRFWIIAASMLLVIPLATSILVPPSDAMLPDELRERAPPPAIPHQAADWVDLPRQLDAFLRDHFGLRPVMIHAQAVVAHLWLRSGNAQVWVGRDGSLFFREDQMLQQSAGLQVRGPEINASADIIAGVRSALAARGIRFLFASPPNSATIYPDALPKWARDENRRTEYDLMLGALAARGVEAVDLRPPLREARTKGDAYSEHDSTGPLAVRLPHSTRWLWHRAGRTGGLILPRRSRHRFRSLAEIWPACSESPRT